MAMSISVLTEGKDNGDGTSKATGSVTMTPAADRLFIVMMVSTKASTTDIPSSVTGNSGTWTQKSAFACTSGSLKRISVFYCTDASGTGGVTFDYGGVTQTGFQWCVLQLDGFVITGTQGADAFVQTKTQNNTTNVTTTGNVAFDSALTAGNAVIAFFAVNQNVNPSVEAGYSSSTGQNHASPACGSRVIWRLDIVDNTPSVTHGNNESGMVAYELQGVPAGPGASIASRTRGIPGMSRLGKIPGVNRW